MSRPRRNASMRSEDIIAEHPPEIRELTQVLRAFVRETVPTATEQAYSVWHGIGFRDPDAGYFCGIFPGKDTVKLGFERGVDLPDPEHILVGDGRQV